MALLLLLLLLCPSAPLLVKTRPFFGVSLISAMYFSLIISQILLSRDETTCFTRDYPSFPAYLWLFYSIREPVLLLPVCCSLLVVKVFAVLVLSVKPADEAAVSFYITVQ